MLSRLDKYILKNFLATFAFLLLAFSAIAIVIDLTEKINDFLKKHVTLREILTYFRDFLPYILALLFPIFIFVAVIFFTSRLANRSEIIAMLGSGMSFKRFLRPYIIGAGIISLVLLVANHYLIPLANQSRLKFEEKYLWDKNYASNDNFHIRVSPTEYIFMQTFNPESKLGYRFSYEKVKGTQLIEQISADRCEYIDSIKMWRLSDVLIIKNNGVKEHMERQQKIMKRFPFSPADITEKREGKQMMTTPVLNAFIDREVQKGSENLNEYYIEKHRRTAAPFSSFVLSIIGACMASRKVRGGSGIHLAVGLMLSAVYIFLMQFSTMFAMKGSLNPFLSVWLPNILFSFLAVYIYRKYSK